MSQGTHTAGKNCISIFSSPCPSQFSQRPPFTLNEKRPIVYPRCLLSLVLAKSDRIGENAPTYVAGLLRGVLPIGDWSMRYTLFSRSAPCSTPYLPGSSR